MTWVKLDDAFFTHRKIISLPLEAKTIFIAGLCFSSAQLTDGFLSQDAIRTILAMLDIPRRKGAKIVQVLEQNSLWKPRGNGYEIHDYLHYQPSAQEVRKSRESTARRVREWRAGNAVSNGVTNSVSNGVSNASPPPKPDPDPLSLSARSSTKGKMIVDAAVAATAAARSVSDEESDAQIAERVAAGMKWAPGSYDPDDLLAVLRCYPDADADELVKEARKCRQAAPKYHKRADLVWLDNWLRKAFPRAQRQTDPPAISDPLSATTDTAPEVEPPPPPPDPLPAVSLVGYREDGKTWRAVAAELRKTATATRFDTVYGGAKLLLPPKSNAPPDADAIPALVLHSRAALELSDRYTREIAAAFQAAAPHIASLRRVCTAQLVTEAAAADEAACTLPADGLPPAEPAPTVIPMAAHRRAPSPPKGA